MSTFDIAPYITGTYDILAFRGTRQNGEVLLNQSLADENSGGEITTGIVKMVQRFLLRLLLERGSAKYRPDEGTDFIRKLRLGQIRTEDGLRGAFTIAEARIKAQFTREERATDTDEERYDRAELTGVIIQPGYANLVMQITSQADSATITLPIPIVV